MTGPPAQPPTSTAVTLAWLRLAVPGPHVDTRLPPISDELREVGAIRLTGVVGGTPDRDVPIRAPVVGVECWVAARATGRPSWGLAENLANRVVAATYDPDLFGVLLDQYPTGDYARARVLAVLALSEPVRVENDPSDFARLDVDLLINWRTEQ